MKKILTYIYLVTIGLITLILFILHTLAITKIVIDYTTITLLIILIILPFLRNLKKLKWGEFEATLGEEVKKLEHAVYVSKEKNAKEIPPTNKRKDILDFKLEQVNNIIEQINQLLINDPVLALAKLRIEFENLIRKINSHFPEIKNKNPGNLRATLLKLRDQGFLSLDDWYIINEIVEICNRAIHGISINYSDAKRVVDMAGEIIPVLVGYNVGQEAEAYAK